MLALIGCTLILGAITGFAVFSEGGFWWGLAGQVVQGLLCIGCFALVGISFWHFGWKIGVLNLFLVFVAGNIGLSSYRYLRRRSGL